MAEDECGDRRLVLCGLWPALETAEPLVCSFLMMAFAGDFMYRILSKWTSMPRVAFNVVLYSFVGAYQIFVFVLNIAPNSANGCSCNNQLTIRTQSTAGTAALPQRTAAKLGN